MFKAWIWGWDWTCFDSFHLVFNPIPKLKRAEHAPAPPSFYELKTQEAPKNFWRPMSHLVAIPTYCIAYFSLLTSSLLAWVVEPRKLYLNSFLVIERDPGPGPMSRSHPGSRTRPGLFLQSRSRSRPGLIPNGIRDIDNFKILPKNSLKSWFSAVFLTRNVHFLHALIKFIISEPELWFFNVENFCILEVLNKKSIVLCCFGHGKSRSRRVEMKLFRNEKVKAKAK